MNVDKSSFLTLIEAITFDKCIIIALHLFLFCYLLGESPKISSGRQSYLRHLRCSICFVQMVVCLQMLAIEHTTIKG